MNTGNQMKRSTHLLLSTVAWRIEEQVNYALEGSVFAAARPWNGYAMASASLIRFRTSSRSPLPSRIAAG